MCSPLFGYHILGLIPNGTFHMKTCDIIIPVWWACVGRLDRKEKQSAFGRCEGFRRKSTFYFGDAKILQRRHFQWKWMKERKREAQGLLLFLPQNVAQASLSHSWCSKRLFGACGSWVMIYLHYISIDCMKVLYDWMDTGTSATPCEYQAAGHFIPAGDRDVWRWRKGKTAGEWRRRRAWPGLRGQTWMRRSQRRCQS